ncbi:MAG: GNAT family N-acetyltransferase [Akkermansiaceae bacterium]
MTSDIRGLLQYVPLFRGKVFVIDIDWGSANDGVKAEILMDLSALQQVGVKLVISMRLEQAQDFFDYSAEIELRVSTAVRSCLDTGLDELLGRGQAFVVAREAALISDELIDLSCSLQATKLICVSAVPELLDADGTVVKFIHINEFKESVSDSSHPAQIQAVKACQAGVQRVHLLNVSQQGVLINELFSSEGVGTMFYTDSYRAIRPIKEEDISEMLGMIGRSVRNTHLVPRTFEDVRDNIEAYYVMEVDDNVVGCGALYEYGDWAEVACLYVKQSHEGTGYGASMVEFLEEKARSKRIANVFALSNRSAEFFKKIGYEEMEINDLPAERGQRLLESGRESGAFQKRF